MVAKETQPFDNFFTLVIISIPLNPNVIFARFPIVSMVKEIEVTLNEKNEAFWELAAQAEFL